MQQTGSAAQVDIGGWVSQGWKMFSAHWGTWVKMSAITMLPVLPGLFAFIFGYVALLQSILPQPGQYGGPSEPPTWIFAVWGIAYLVIIVGSFVSLYFQLGMWKAALKTARGGTPALSDLKGNGHLYFRTLGAAFVVGLLTMLGIFACYIGAFVVMGWYIYVQPLIVDRDLTIGDAMRTSKAAVTGQLLMYILFAFVVGILQQIGAYACLIGIIATFPLHFTIHAVAYTRTFDQPAAPPAAAFPAAPTPGAWGAPPPAAG